MLKIPSSPMPVRTRAAPPSSGARMSGRATNGGEGGQPGHTDDPGEAVLVALVLGHQDGDVEHVDGEDDGGRRQSEHGGAGHRRARREIAAAAPAAARIGRMRIHGCRSPMVT